MLTSFLSVIIFLLLNGLANFLFYKVIGAAILVSFVPAILRMLIIPFAKNKIEGVTLFKGINVVLFIPIIAFFIAPEWKVAFGIIPFYWVYEILQTPAENEFLTSFFPGLILNGVFFYMLVRFFNKTFMKQTNL